MSGVLPATDPLSAAPASIDVPAGSLRDALTILSIQANISIAVAGKLPALRTRRVHGRMEARDALAQLLAGSEWQARMVGPNLWQLVRVPKKRDRPAPVPVTPTDDPAGPDIVVTALKRNQRLLNTPAAITVIAGSAFAGANTARGSSDIAEQAGSVYSTNLGPGRDRLFLRGVADSPFNGPTQSTVGLFLDDSRINYARPDPDLRLVDIDAVEILRGPQGTLYGTGALGGIVRIATNRPVFDRWGGGAALEGSSTANGGPGGAIEAYLNAPVSDAVAVRAVGYTDTAGGWIDDGLRAKPNINRVGRTGGRVDLRWKVSRDWTIDISAVAQDLRASDTQYATAGLTHESAMAEPHRNQFFLGRVEARGKIVGLDFLSTTAIESNQFDNRFDASAVASTRGLDAPLAFDERRKIFLVSQEFRLSDPHDAHRWVAGVSLIDAIDLTTGNFVPPSGPVVDTRARASLSLEVAAFGEATQSLGKNVDLTLGLRAVTSSIYDDPRTAPAGGIHSFGFTPSATLSWRPSSNALLWVRYAGATRPGGRNQNSAGELVTFKADDLKSLELGSRLTLIDRHLTINSTIFGLVWRNVQSDVIGSDGLVITANAGDAHNYGVEIDASAKWSNFTLNASFTRQHGRLTPAGTLSGESVRLPVLPDVSGRMRLGWDSHVAGLDAGAYVSGNFWGSAQLSFNPAEEQRVPGRATLNTGVTIGRDHWRVAFSIANLLDSRRDTFAFGNPFSFRLVPQHTPERPRTLGVRFERAF